MQLIGLSGVLIPLLIHFLSSPRDDRKWFKIYVIYVNILALVQTGVHLYDGLSVAGSQSIHPAVSATRQVTTLYSYTLKSIKALALSPILTTILGASVQLFFIFRCWRIFQQRLLFIMPFLALWVSALIPGILLVRHISRLIVFNLTHVLTSLIGGIVYGSVTED
jgi:hypothetical protein